MKKEYLNKFYQKTHEERLHALVSAEVILEEDTSDFKRKLQLPEETANHMIENQISTYELPLGIGLNFFIDQKEYVVPMATEEPSVIAAASSAAKIIRQAGGFKTSIQERTMIGQIALKDVSNMKEAEEIILQHEDQIIEKANQAHPSIVKRGGGARSVKVRQIEADEQYNAPAFFVIHIHIQTLEAMGANIINTMVEAVKPYLESLTGGTAIMGILSNYATECLATATCHIPVSLLRKGSFSGEEVRDRIIEAGQFAVVDPYRAVTHNKGIMNGIDAVVLASGNDTRAIEAGVHAYATRSGQYRSLSNWSKAENGDLVGTMTIPLPVGTVGGSINIHPGAIFSKQLLGNPTAQELEAIIVSVGLGQNFSALKALVTEGIQKGHMGLHAKSLAISAGAVGDQIDLVSNELKKRKNMNLATAKEILEQIKDI
ncbi:3-hydroxy-3-methylglutaryl coenzyme A reductase [Paraliobacillus quinghaiensis]|uniref:3-hydroxy-3-methylglutaryl coenzyme A reductase n=1 Tax=Paraliobacillus quinghaiensis TaxID=470815 RepID=A0A917THJ4_9BACI|nr:hydroxymethylglutaryl-CoA reductase, degradative [Paraliobacillus quinghaiensis]GGM23714.1 3-hydroxy-3-methylglutaryl coenzyme A reductase [Paraliobacillus quinghaiensis]